MANPPIPSVDPTTGLFSPLVRKKLAAALQDSTSLEGAAVAFSVANRPGAGPVFIANGTGTDQINDLQAAYDAMPAGQEMWVFGQVRTSKPFIGARNKGLRMMATPRWSYQTTPVNSIRPLSTFVGLAAILIPEASIVDATVTNMATARTAANDNGWLTDVAVDCSAINPGGDRGIYGVFFEGLVRNWKATNVNVLSARGIGFACRTGRGSNNPRGITIDHVQSVYSKGIGMYFANTTDSHINDILAVGGEVDGIVMNGCSETHTDEVRSVFNKGRGVVLGGIKSVANSVRINTISTDRNAFDGVAIEQTGTFPLHIKELSLNRDGSASATADYAGLVLGTTASRICPVIIDHLSVIPGVDDPATAGAVGGGNLSPQHAVRMGLTTRVAIISNAMWAAGDPVLDKGDHGNTPQLGLAMNYQRKGSDGTVVVSSFLGVTPTASTTPTTTTAATAMPTATTVTSSGHTFKLTSSNDFTTAAATGTAFTSTYQMASFNEETGDTGTNTTGGRYSTVRTVSVANSALHIDQKWYTDPNGVQRPYGACIMPDNYAPHTYGRSSIRYRTKDVAGVGGFKFVALWWDTGDNWNNGEIDWPEQDNGKTPRPASAIPGSGVDSNGALSKTSGNYPVKMTFEPTTETPAPNDSTDWHIATTDWYPGGVSFYWDGVLVATVTKGVPTTPMRFELQFETWLNEGVTPANAAGYAEVDWFAIYDYVS